MPLNPEQVEQFRGLIDARRKALLSEIREDSERVRDEPYGEHAGEAPDAGDASVATLYSDLDQADLNRDVGEVRALDAAVERIEQGSYGICEDCGTDIAEGRLRAFPAALRCVRCQERYEKTFATPKGSTL
jgi:DnaK suppressor protein